MNKLLVFVIVSYIAFMLVGMSVSARQAGAGGQTQIVMAE